MKINKEGYKIIGITGLICLLLGTGLSPCEGDSPVTRDEAGITTISIYDFLLKDNSLEL